MALLSAPRRRCGPYRAKAARPAGHVGMSLALVISGTDWARGQEIDEYQVKAAFLYNFAKFVEWPPQAFKSSSDPITICILGRNPFGTAIEEAVRGKAVEGRVFTVHPVSKVAEARGCQILFVSSSERKHLHSILGDLNISGVLTVGEGDGFTGEGGVIGFKLEGSRIRFEINAGAAERGSLRISSKLLSLAESVKK